MITTETPKPIVTKFGMGDYADDVTQYAKIQTDRPSGGVPANGWYITLAWFLVILWPQFLLRPETKPENRFLRGLIHMISIPGFWFPRGIKLQKIPISPIFTPKTPPTLAWIDIFKLNDQNIKTCILSKLTYCTDSNQILHSNRDHQNTLRGWSKQAYNKSKMADSRHLERLKMNVSTDLH